MFLNTPSNNFSLNNLTSLKKVCIFVPNKKIRTMPGCNECKFYKSELVFNEESGFSFKRSCLAGNTDQLLFWWEENGNKQSKDELTDLPCHEVHESMKSLIEMNRLVDSMIEVVDHTFRSPLRPFKNNYNANPTLNGRKSLKTHYSHLKTKEMTALALYKFLQDVGLEWRDDELVAWIEGYRLEEFTDMFPYSYFADGPMSVSLCFDGSIVLDLVPICEYFGFEPTDILKKQLQ